MKHNLLVTIFLVAFFVLAQIVGLSLISKDAKISISPTGNITVTHSDTSVGARPETTGFGSFLYIIIGVGIGTILVLILVKYRQSNLWRIWFLLAVWIAISISLGVIVKNSIFFEYDIAIFISLLLALWKIFKPNIIIHNVTEVLMYSGIAVLIVPIFTSSGDGLFWVIMLLIVISFYDVYAVWKSKHMVRMAKFQTEAKIFAGLMIPYKPKPTLERGPENKAKLTTSDLKNTKKVIDTTIKSEASKNETKNAILGGGDVAFPLIFEGVVMEYLLQHGLTKVGAFLQTSIIVLTATIAISLLFFFAKKDKFYPAMPFITAGCLIGWLLMMII